MWALVTEKCTDCLANFEGRKQCQEQLMHQMCQNETLCRHVVLHVTILHSTIVVPSLLCGNESSNAFFIIIIYILFELCILGGRFLHL